MDTQQIIDNCERIVTTIIKDFLVRGCEDPEVEDLAFKTIQTLDSLAPAVREADL
jgi:hypothetical protein